ncbi:hypothetical protein IEN92_04210 [Polynucleobacter sp. MWH-Creno-3A4]|uniref:hypothetical protein n=1 Tax=Polynucleobacter sp. MWH-Creno-3A4 TaxID=1855886 RepID=UPI001C0B72E3|nr:hypothetical protein [Polynucleobacter sp. MWH-Creno-3A4]MBU3605949.1 hypothetical protein [Polynucleobacter sp. MWH-Creno-3A4]
MSRGILSIYWGDETKLPIDRLKASVKKFHPELTHEIIKIEAPVNEPSSLNKKAAMFELSPFEETLFLDLDTVVLGNLDFGFEKARQFGLALSICESPWGKRYQNIFKGDEIEYNTGVIFFAKQAKSVFEKWSELANIVDSSILGVNKDGPYRMPANDQGSFALAIQETGFNPFVLPMNWNFRPQWQRSFFGPIKIWHDYVDPPPFFEELSKYYSSGDSIIQYHQG